MIIIPALLSVPHKFCGFWLIDGPADSLGRQAQPNTAAATLVAVVRIASVPILAIFRRRAFFVTIMDVSFAVASCWSMSPSELIATLQPSVARIGRGPSSAGLSLSAETNSSAPAYRPPTVNRVLTPNSRGFRSRHRGPDWSRHVGVSAAQIGADCWMIGTRHELWGGGVT